MTLVETTREAAKGLAKFLADDERGGELIIPDFHILVGAMTQLNEAASTIERLERERDSSDAQIAAQNALLNTVWNVLDRSKGENLLARVTALVAAEAERDAAVRNAKVEHELFLVEADKHSEWLENCTRQQARAERAEAERDALAKALEEAEAILDFARRGYANPDVSHETYRVRVAQLAETYMSDRTASQALKGDKG